MYDGIKRMEKAMGLTPKKINQMNPSDVMKYYDELIEMKDKWEEDNQQELKY
jgi:hypothetical protein